MSTRSFRLHSPMVYPPYSIFNGLQLPHHPYFLWYLSTFSLYLLYCNANLLLCFVTISVYLISFNFFLYSVVKNMDVFHVGGLRFHWTVPLFVGFVFSFFNLLLFCKFIISYRFVLSTYFLKKILFFVNLFLCVFFTGYFACHVYFSHFIFGYNKNGIA